LDSPNIPVGTPQSAEIGVPGGGFAIPGGKNLPVQDKELQEFFKDTFPPGGGVPGDGAYLAGRFGGGGSGGGKGSSSSQGGGYSTDGSATKSSGSFMDAMAR
jgi:hypothetical protein